LWINCQRRSMPTPKVPRVLAAAVFIAAAGAIVCAGWHHAFRTPPKEVSSPSATPQPPHSTSPALSEVSAPSFGPLWGDCSVRLGESWDLLSRRIPEIAGLPSHVLDEIHEKLYSSPQSAFRDGGGIVYSTKEGTVTHWSIVGRTRFDVALATASKRDVLCRALKVYGSMYDLAVEKISPTYPEEFVTLTWRDGTSTAKLELLNPPWSPAKREMPPMLPEAYKGQWDRALEPAWSLVVFAATSQVGRAIANEGGFTVRDEQRVRQAREWIEELGRADVP